MALIGEGGLEGAIEHLHQALVLDPGYPDCRSNLGVAPRSRHNHTKAIAELREASRLRPENAEFAAALGEAMSLIYDREAEATLRRALRPDDPEKHWNLTLDLLKQGKYSECWQEFERRWERTLNQASLPTFSQPYWRGRAGQELSYMDLASLCGGLAMAAAVPSARRASSHSVVSKCPHLSPDETPRRRAGK